MNQVGNKTDSSKIFSAAGLDDLILVDSEKTRKKLEFWVERKGYFLYKQAAQILFEKNGSKTVYEEVASLIRYDKSLRDCLYVYLAAYEEYVRKELCDNFDIQDTELLLKKDISKNVLINAKPYRSKLFYQISEKHVDLCDLLKLAAIAHIEIDCEKAEAVRNLRNCAMNHSMICLGTAETLKEAIKNLETTKREIEALFALLPKQEYKTGLEKTLNNLNKVNAKNFTSINLGRMENGIFRKVHD